MGLAPATNVKCYALKCMFEDEVFPWHVGGDITVEALTGGRYTIQNGRWKSVSLAKPRLIVYSCPIPDTASFLEGLGSLLRHFQREDEDYPYQTSDERRIALRRWQALIQMQPRLYPEAVKEYERICTS